MTLTNKLKSHFYTVIILLIAIGLNSCGLSVSYKMTGASTGDAKTFSVAPFPNRADIINPSLSQEVGEMIKDLIISRTKLELVPVGGDVSFEGEIIGYSTDPAAITGNETAALNRFTIEIKVKYTNLLDAEQDFERTFRHFSEYDSNQSLDAVEGDLVPEILEKIVEDIFNQALVNW
jgi:hypothetical protein